MPSTDQSALNNHYLIAAPLDILDRDTLFPLLSPEEQARANRYKQVGDQERHILAHSLKRFCLSQYLDLPASCLTFSTGEKGKPICDQADTVDFNIGHSGSWILFGLSALGTIGVDVEHGFREVSDAVTDYALNQAQCHQVKTANAPEQTMMVFWTQKEAISKALGLGLSMNFKTLECSGDIGVSSYVTPNERLRVETRPTADDYLVSVATKSETPVTFFRLNRWNGRIVELSHWE